MSFFKKHVFKYIKFESLVQLALVELFRDRGVKHIISAKDTSNYIITENM